LETALLIGSHLGFLIIGVLLTAWGAWLFRADAAKSASAREETARRLALTEEVALQCGTLHHRFQRYCNLLGERIAAGPAFSADRQLELEKAHQELLVLADELSEADSKLLLLGETSLAKLLRVYAAKVLAVRRQYPGNLAKLNDEVLKQQRQEVNGLRDRFFKSLSQCYGRKPNAG